jgi:hypothetical protein
MTGGGVGSPWWQLPTLDESITESRFTNDLDEIDKKKYYKVVDRGHYGDNGNTTYYRLNVPEPKAMRDREPF